MKLLAIDTSMDACSAALSIAGELRETFEVAPRKQAERILPMVERLLAEADLGLTDLDALAFGRGPGSFTGLRIAAGVIQGLAFGADLPVVPVSTLAAIAQGVSCREGAKQVLVAIDARMQEVYWGAYQRKGDQLMILLGEEHVSPPAEVRAPVSGTWFAAGSGWTVYDELRGDRWREQLSGQDSSFLPHARDIAELAVAAWRQGKAIAAEEAQPCYLRDRVVSSHDQPKAPVD